jgi:ketosteroid isomerase-like protein
MSITSSAQTFITALQKVEETRDVTPLTELFANDCSVSNLAMQEPATGREGAEQFWRQYLHVFQKIHSEFSYWVETDRAIVLEWNSRGRLNDGQPVQYAGVSVIEKADGKVQRFRTYYDSAAFTPAGKRPASGSD